MSLFETKLDAACRRVRNQRDFVHDKSEVLAAAERIER
jgi:hypothetical protein